MSGFLAKLTAPLEQLRDWTLQFACTPGAPWWLFALAFAESSFFPIPPDVLLIAMGLTESALADPGIIFFYALICSLGSVLGGCLGYCLGYWGGRPLADKLFSEKKVEAVERMYARFDMWAVAVAGFTPVPYKVFTITTGLLKAGFWRFTLASALSRSARFFMVATLLYFFGEKTRELLDKYIGPATLALVAVAVLGFLAIKFFAGRHKDASPDAREREEGAGEGGADRPEGESE